jgi:hypothetical protein
MEIRGTESLYSGRCIIDATCQKQGFSELGVPGLAVKLERGFLCPLLNWS